MLPFFRKLEACLIGMEACGTSHYWARELSGLGHRVKLMPPAYVKPYVKRGKPDAGDAEAIAEAVTWPTMRFVAIKSPGQQSILALHRTRDLLVGQRTQLVNMIRAQLAEFGVVLPKGIHHALKHVDRLLDGAAPDIPTLAHTVVIALAGQIRDLEARIGELETEPREPSRGNGVVRRLQTILGIGPITASAPAATGASSNRPAWLGLTPRAESSGGKERMGPDPRKPSGPAVHKTPHQQAGHKTVPDPVATPSNNPCNAGAIHTGHSTLILLYELK